MRGKRTKSKEMGEEERWRGRQDGPAPHEYWRAEGETVGQEGDLGAPQPRPSWLQAEQRCRGGTGLSRGSGLGRGEDGLQSNGLHTSGLCTSPACVTWALDGVKSHEPGGRRGGDTAAGKAAGGQEARWIRASALNRALPWDSVSKICTFQARVT